MTLAQKTLLAFNLPDATVENREYKAFKLRQIRTDLTAQIKALEKSAYPGLPLPEPEPKGAK